MGALRKGEAVVALETERRGGLPRNLKRWALGERGLDDEIPRASKAGEAIDDDEKTEKFLGFLARVLIPGEDGENGCPDYIEEVKGKGQCDGGS